MSFPDLSNSTLLSTPSILTFDPGVADTINVILSAGSACVWLNLIETYKKEV